MVASAVLQRVSAGAPFPAFVILMALVAACSGSNADVVRAGTGDEAPDLASRGAEQEASPTDLGHFRPLPPRTDAVPVLLFHQICEGECAPSETYGISRIELARTFVMLREAGFRTITAAAYDAFLAGVGSLPRQPILVTFDDGRRRAHLAADAVLATEGAVATQFIITEKAESEADDFLSWSEIAAAQASGRWDIQLHARNGHRTIPVGPGSTGSFYGNRAYDPIFYPRGQHLEPFASWRARVENDIIEGEATLARHVPGYRSVTFALPFGDYGQFASNDARIASAQRAFLDRRYRAWFTQPSSDPDFTRREGGHEKWRYTVRYGTTAETLYAWLASHSGAGGMREALESFSSSDAGRD